MNAGDGLEGPLQWLQLLEITPAPGGSFTSANTGKSFYAIRIGSLQIALILCTKALNKPRSFRPAKKSLLTPMQREIPPPRPRWGEARHAPHPFR
jgi:hypothetical protein